MTATRRTDEEWQELIEKQAASGQSQAAWCAAHGINQYTLRDRARRLRRKEEVPVPKPVESEQESAGWMEVSVKQIQEKPAGICIEHGGFSVRVTAGFDEELLTEVLRAVSRVCC